MKKLFLFGILIVAVALFAASCGESTTTTISAPATTASTTTSSTAASTTSSTPASGESTTSSSTAQPGEVKIDLIGAEMVPPVESPNTAELILSLQDAALAYELDSVGLTPSDVTSAGIYIKTDTSTSTTAAGGTASTAAPGAGAKDGEMVVDLLAGQTANQGGTESTAASGATVIAKGTLSEQNLVGSWGGKRISDLITLFATLGGEGQDVWVQINTQQYPDGELRGYIDLAGLIQQMMSGATGTTGTTAAGSTTPTS